MQHIAEASANGIEQHMPHIVQHGGGLNGGANDTRVGDIIVARAVVGDEVIGAWDDGWGARGGGAIVGVGAVDDDCVCANNNAAGGIVLLGVV